MFSDYVSSQGTTNKSAGTGHPKKFTPTPTDEDYEDGFLKRYFAQQKRPPRKITEISQRQFNSYDKIQKGLSQDLYEVFSFEWKIRGPRNDIYKNDIPVRNGVEDTNLSTLKLEEEDHPGISDLLDDPLEFWEERRE